LKLPPDVNEVPGVLRGAGFWTEGVGWVGFCYGSRLLGSDLLGGGGAGGEEEGGQEVGEEFHIIQLTTEARRHRVFFEFLSGGLFIFSHRCFSGRGRHKKRTACCRPFFEKI